MSIHALSRCDLTSLVTATALLKLHSHANESTTHSNNKKLVFSKTYYLGPSFMQSWLSSFHSELLFLANPMCGQNMIMAVHKMPCRHNSVPHDF